MNQSTFSHATLDNLINKYLDILSPLDKKDLKEELYYNVAFNRSFKEAILRLANMIEFLLTNQHKKLDEELNYFIEHFQEEHPFTRTMRLKMLDGSLDSETLSSIYNIGLLEVNYKMCLLKKYISRPLLITNDSLTKKLTTLSIVK